MAFKYTYYDSKVGSTANFSSGVIGLYSPKGVPITTITPITATSATAFSYLPIPSGPRTMQNYIASFGVVGSSANDNTTNWTYSFSGITPLAYTASPITTSNYFTQGSGVRFIIGDGSSDPPDWAVITFVSGNGTGDFDGAAQGAGAAWFGSESGTNGGSHGNTVSRGRVWGFSTSLGWVLLYVLDLPGGGTYNHTNGGWFTIGGTLVTGAATVLGKRTEYDNLSITHMGFSVGTV
jgi:hypothetical protein